MFFIDKKESDVWFYERVSKIRNNLHISGATCKTNYKNSMSLNNFPISKIGDIPFVDLNTRIII